ncbi:MAG: argininosuccinate lyase [Chloroflexi bacterium RBG_16_68_14]|nr:MAG: argininosuccinate lyase [Chloroflexi bacterium RBG_16_68_14]
MAEAYTLSLPIDRRLWREEIAASIAHARMLGRQRIIPRADASAIVRGLREIQREMTDGRFPWREELEDVHTNVEARLREKIGAAAGRLHTARSRNDQVATDLRLYAKGACDRAVAAVRALQRALLALAEANRQLAMPGYTHLQRAQPVLLAHHLLAYLEMLERDIDRFANARRRADVLPLGSGALAGVPYPIDREAVAHELGFSRISDNSIDAVSDRDFAVDFIAAAALCMTHLSRLAEEMVLWSSAEFGFLRLPEAFATGSSIMPQKRNPDVAELARARTGRVYGQLLSILTTLKALPLAYNRDLQEDKRAFFEAEDTLLETLAVFAAMVPELRFDVERARRAATADYALATDLADYLVRRGLPFRRAHEVVGRLVQYAEERGKSFSQLTLAEYRRFSPLFSEEVTKLDLTSALRARDAPGGTAPRQVAAALLRWRRRLALTEGRASARRSRATG